MPNRSETVKRCLDAWLRLARTADAQQLDNEKTVVPELCAGLQELSEIGSFIEAAFVRQLAARLPQRVACSQTELVRGQLMRTAAHLDGVPWLPESNGGGRLGRPVRVCFIRHAESTGNQEQRLLGTRFHGQLTPLGRAQSLRTADYLPLACPDLAKDHVLLVSSPMLRAMETAQPISERLDCPISTVQDLAELDAGDWSGQYFSELERSPAYRAWMEDKWFNLPPGGESMFEVRTRACEAFCALLLTANDAVATIVVVTHFFPLMALFDALVPGTGVRPDNSSISCFEYNDGHWQASMINYTAHLGEHGAKPVAYV